MTTSEINLRVTGQSSQGGRKYMEDAFVVAYQQTEDKKDLEYAFFGIFDGHGGKEAAQYAKNNLLDNIVSLKQFWQNDDDLILGAIRDGFLNTHLAMWKEVENWPKTASGLPSTAGTTASIAFIRKGKLYTGHVGDSRIIIGFKEQGTDEWQAESLTVDHKPESPLEKQRIIDSGGLVMNKSGVERVVWKRPRPGHEGPILRSTDFEKIPFLAVARSLGDLWSYDYFQQEFAVSPEPDLGVMNLDLSKDKCLILASDGVWNIMSPESAVHLVQDVENENGKVVAKFGVSENIHLTLCNPSRVLVDCALERWNQLRTRADNVSVITVMLDETKSSEVGVLREQLVLKMNYPRSLPVWDVGLRSKSSAILESEALEVSKSLPATNLVQEKEMENKTDCPHLPLRNLSCDKNIQDCACHSGREDSSSDGKCCLSGKDQGGSLENCCINNKNCQGLPEHCKGCNHHVDNGLNADRHTSSPLQSCSNFLPEYFSKMSRKADADGIENSPCPFPRWSKSASGRTSLSTLVTWSKVVSHRRMSDPFPHQNVEPGPSTSDDYSLSDDEGSNQKVFQRGTSWNIEDMGLQKDLCDENVPDMFTKSASCTKNRMTEPQSYPCSWRSTTCSLEDMGLQEDLCDENVPDMFTKSVTGTKNRITEPQSFKVSLDQLCNIKQAIKRKYPGAEISQSFIGSSCSMDSFDDASSHKRKLDMNSSLLKIMNVEVQS